MLNKRLLMVAVLLNSLGLVPQVLLAKRVNEKKPAICFELAKDQYKEYFTSEKAQNLIIKMNEDCALYGKNVQQSRAAGLDYALWLATIDQNPEVRERLLGVVLDPHVNLYGLHDRVNYPGLLPRWITQYGLLPAFFISYVRLLSLPHDGSEVRMFYMKKHESEIKDVWSALEKIKQERGDTHGDYYVKYQEAHTLLKWVFGKDTTVTMQTKNEALAFLERSCEEAERLRSEHCIFWLKVTAVFAVVAGLEMYYSSWKERKHQRAFDEFMKNPDAHVILAQKLNEFCEGISKLEQINALVEKFYSLEPDAKWHVRIGWLINKFEGNWPCQLAAFNRMIERVSVVNDHASLFDDGKCKSICGVPAGSTGLFRLRSFSLEKYQSIDTQLKIFTAIMAGKIMVPAAVA